MARVLFRNRTILDLLDSFALCRARLASSQVIASLNLFAKSFWKLLKNFSFKTPNIRVDGSNLEF